MKIKKIFGQNISEIWGGDHYDKSKIEGFGQKQGGTHCVGDGYENYGIISNFPFKKFIIVFKNDYEFYIIYISYK